MRRSDLSHDVEFRVNYSKKPVHCWNTFNCLYASRMCVRGVLRKADFYLRVLLFHPPCPQSDAHRVHHKPLMMDCRRSYPCVTAIKPECSSLGRYELMNTSIDNLALLELIKSQYAGLLATNYLASTLLNHDRQITLLT